MKEQMLKEKQKGLNSIYAIIPSAIFTVDTKRRITSWNNKAAELTGYTAEEVVGKECFVFSEAPCKEKCGLYSDDVAKPIIGKECKIRKKDRQVCTILKNSDFLRDKEGNIIGGIESFEDISKHKEAETKLQGLKAELELRVRVRTADLSKTNEDLHKEIRERRKMEEEILRLRDFYGSTLDNIKTGVWVADRDGVITYANKGMSDIDGIGVDKITGVRLADFSESRLKHFMEYYLKAKVLLKPLRYESIPVITPAGRQSYQTGWLIPVVKNNEFNAMICTVEDVTEHNRFEYELKKFKFISDNSSEAFYLVDKEGRFVYVNNTACKRMGYTEDELLKLNVPDVDTIYDKKRYQELFNLIQIEDVLPFETINKRKDGTVFPVEISVTGIKFGEDKFMFAVARDITERKKAEEKSRLNSEIFKNVAEGIYLVGLEDGIIKYANPRFAKMFGYESAELIGKEVSIVNAPTEKSPEQTRDEIVGILKKTGEWHGEVKNIKKDGTYFWCYANVSLFDHSKYGRVIVSVHTDITESNKAKEALRESEERFGILVDRSFDGIFIHDNFKILDINARMAQILGSSVSLLIGTDILRFVTPDSQKKVHQYIISGQKGSYEVEMRKADGKIIHAEAFGANCKFKGLDARIVGIRDITERRVTEDLLRENEAALSDLFSSIQDGISILDKQMNIVRVNHIMEEWYGHAMPLVGKKCYEAYHCASFPCKVCPTEHTLKTGKSAYELVPKRSGSGKVTGWLDLYSFPLRDQKTGQMKGVIEYVRDITARKLAEDEGKKLNSELIKTNKRLKQITLTDSHTGLYNHRYLGDVIEAEFHRAKRYAHPIAVIMLDIDYFKSINDVYGHEFGDLVLKQFARQLKMMVRRYDMVVRFGGEEFIIISPGIDRTQALSLGQRTLDALNLYNFGDKKHSVNLKLSLAVVSYQEDRFDKGIEMINVADQILSNVKELGGNKVYSSLDIIKNKRAVRSKHEENVNIEFLKSKVAKLNRKANQGLVESILAFARTIKLKDRYTGEHVGNTVRYVTEIGRELDLSKHEAELVRQAAVLHDLGKIGISDKILLKKGKLTKREFEEIKKHPQIGADIIRPIQFLHELIPLILYHHERWDGKGYPTGIKGERIPMGARIIAIADVYQSLTSDRPYRKAYPKKDAIKIIEKSSGSHFDPEIVKVFLKIVHSCR